MIWEVTTWTAGPHFLSFCLPAGPAEEGQGQWEWRQLASNTAGCSHRLSQSALVKIQRISLVCLSDDFFFFHGGMEGTIITWWRGEIKEQSLCVFRGLTALKVSSVSTNQSCGINCNHRDFIHSFALKLTGLIISHSYWYELHIITLLWHLRGKWVYKIIVAAHYDI